MSVSRLNLALCAVYHDSELARQALSNIVKIVQGHLVTLGYDPGNTSGDLTKQTVDAITKFEAATGLPVTGQAVPSLIAALEAEIAAQR